MTDHTCDERCSKRQTADTLRALGYDLPELRSDAGAMEKMTHERLVQNAKHQAQLDKKVRLCTRTVRLFDNGKYRV